VLHGMMYHSKDRLDTNPHVFHKCTSTMTQVRIYSMTVGCALVGVCCKRGLADLDGHLHRKVLTT
jgi:hypothetical protein